MKNKNFLLGLLTGMTSTLVILILCYSIYVYQTMNRSSESDSTATLSEVGLNYSRVESKMRLLEQSIDKYYLDQVTEQDVEDGIFKGLVESLDDPYSKYYTADEYESLQESSSGNYCGIGAVVSQNKQTGIITILNAYENGPAGKAGLKEGDILYAVDGKAVEDRELTDIVSDMKGEEGTTVTISILRGEEDKPRDFTITRGNVEVPTVAYDLLDDKIGYIVVSEFDEVTKEQFRNAIDDLLDQGMNGLVIDLRDNPGGLLDTVVDMLDRLIDKGMLVYTKDKNGDGNEYKADDQDSLDLPLSVLINGNSASASEVFAGAVQDYGIGTLVGTTSFGKGIVQSIVPFSDGTAVKLTISKYYTPNGRNIHGTGIDPDVEVELDEEALSQSESDSSKDIQLQKAIQVVKDKIG